MADTPAKPPRKLTARQELFCRYYVGCLNATQAAKDAGYRALWASEIGYSLLQKSTVRARIDELNAHAMKEIGVTKERVLKELTRIAFGGMGKLSRWNESGVTFRDSSELDEDTLATVQEVSESTNQHGGSLKIKQHDKAKALELLGRHLKLFADRVELTGKDGGPVESRDVSKLTDEELEAKILEGIAKLNPEAPK